MQVNPSTEDYFGEELRSFSSCAISAFAQSQSQHFAMELYESRVASLQRFVAMTVMFHQMGKQVQDFFPRISFGYLGYQMDRTQSILRIATTASPVSGDAVRERMETLRLRSTFQNAVRIIGSAWLRRQNRHFMEFKAERFRKSLSPSFEASKKTVIAHASMDYSEEEDEQICQYLQRNGSKTESTERCHKDLPDGGRVAEGTMGSSSY